MQSGDFWKRKFHNTVKFLYFINLGFKQKRCLQRAADLAYTSLGALVPTIVVFLSVISSIKFFPQDFEKKIEHLIFTNLIPETRQRLSEQVAQYVQGFASAAGTIGFIGGVCMLITVYLLLNTIESNFNSIMNVEKSRSFLRKISAYTSAIVWTPILVALTFTLHPQVTLHFSFLNQLNIFYHYALIVGIFTMAYKIIPNQVIPTLHALRGGVAATVLWMCANSSFTNIVSKMVNYDKIYGTLGAIPLFLLWLYIVWVIMLIGMEVTYIFQNFRLLEAGLKPVKSLDRMALKILRQMGETFISNSGFETNSSLMQKLNFPEYQIEKIMDVLVENKIVSKMADEEHYTLAKDPKYILLWNVVSLFLDSFQVRESEGQVIYSPLQYPLPKEISHISLADWIKKEAEQENAFQKESI